MECGGVEWRDEERGAAAPPRPGPRRSKGYPAHTPKRAPDRPDSAPKKRGDDRQVQPPRVGPAGNANPPCRKIRAFRPRGAAIAARESRCAQTTSPRPNHPDHRAETTAPSSQRPVHSAGLTAPGSQRRGHSAGVTAIVGGRRSGQWALRGRSLGQEMPGVLAGALTEEPRRSTRPKTTGAMAPMVGRVPRFAISDQGRVPERGVRPLASSCCCRRHRCGRHG